MIRINLIPTKAAKKKEDAALQIIVGAVVCGLVAVACYIVNAQMNRNIREQETIIMDLDVKIKRLASIKREVEEFKKKKQDLEKKIKTIESLNQQRSGPVKLMEEFSNVVPQKLWIAKYREVNKQLSLEGSALDGPTVADFVDNLRQSKFFHNVQLIQVEQIKGKGQALQKFTLTCMVNYLVGG